MDGWRQVKLDAVLRGVSRYSPVLVLLLGIVLIVLLSLSRSDDGEPTGAPRLPVARSATALR